MPPTPIMGSPNALLGRSSGPELLYSTNIAMTAPATVNSIPPINLRRGLERLLIKWSGRIAVSAANVTDVAIEALPNLLQLILLQGTHRQYGALTPIQMTGATAFAWSQLFDPNGFSFCTINGVLQSGLGTPAASGFLGTTAGSPYDVVIVWDVPLGPSCGSGQAQRRQATSFLYQPNDWGDTLQLQLNFADKSGLGDAAASTIAFTGYASAAGTPSVEIFANYSLLGVDLLKKLAGNSGVTLRRENALTQFTAAGTAVLLANLQKQITTNVLIKTGVLEGSNITSGVTTFESLSDYILDQTQIQVDNKALRDNRDNIVEKAFYNLAFNARAPEGYLLLSFVDSLNALTAYRADILSNVGATFGLVSDILTTSSLQRVNYVQEICYGGPFGN